MVKAKKKSTAAAGEEVAHVAAAAIPQKPKKANAPKQKLAGKMVTKNAKENSESASTRPTWKKVWRFFCR